jgi:hypothetical protein
VAGDINNVRGGVIATTVAGAKGAAKFAWDHKWTLATNVLITNLQAFPRIFINAYWNVPPAATEAIVWTTRAVTLLPTAYSYYKGKE